MYLSRHLTARGARWALDGRHLPTDFALEAPLELPAADLPDFFESLPRGEAAERRLLPPIEPAQEVWASGVTYEMSREARMAESGEADVYEKVYDAERPELFFKALGHRVIGHGGKVRVRADSRWNVPEPELVLLLNGRMEIVGYTAGNDISSREIEGENPLYLPQAKIYDGSCALGPGIVLLPSPGDPGELRIGMRIQRGAAVAFEGETSTSRMRRSLEELAAYLGREYSLPSGAFLMTGTGIVPPDDFTLAPGDEVEISVGDLVLINEVANESSETQR
jgi:2-dehydro-3-deoxy-D-arabinonate dehydratase